MSSRRELRITEADNGFTLEIRYLGPGPGDELFVTRDAEELMELLESELFCQFDDPEPESTN